MGIFTDAQRQSLRHSIGNAEGLLTSQLQTMQDELDSIRGVVSAPVDSSTVIEIGDLIWLDTDDVKPASALSYGGSLAATQETFHDSFLGVALDASADGETDPIRVATSGDFEFDCASASFALGARVGADDNAPADELTDQQVIAVASPETSIGRVAAAVTSATSVTVRIQSTIMSDGPQAVA